MHEEHVNKLYNLSHKCDRQVFMVCSRKVLIICHKSEYFQVPETVVETRATPINGGTALSKCIRSHSKNTKANRKQ